MGSSYILFFPSDLFGNEFSVATNKILKKKEENVNVCVGTDREFDERLKRHDDGTKEKWERGERGGTDHG